VLPAWFSSAGHQAADAPAFDRLGEIAAPALVLHGDADRVVPCRAGLRLSEALARARFASVADAGHALPLSHKELIANAIEDFVRE
jgi:pimeloyl-ACP methyl ester carboxylesterase